MGTFSSVLQYETLAIILIWNVLRYKCWQHTSQTVVNSDLKVAYYQIDESEIKLHANEDNEVDAFMPRPDSGHSLLRWRFNLRRKQDKEYCWSMAWE